MTPDPATLFRLTFLLLRAQLVSPNLVNREDVVMLLPDTTLIATSEASERLIQGRDLVHCNAEERGGVLALRCRPATAVERMKSVSSVQALQAYVLALDEERPGAMVLVHGAGRDLVVKASVLVPWLKKFSFDSPSISLYEPEPTQTQYSAIAVLGHTSLPDK